MEVRTIYAQATRDGPEQYFTGKVRVKPLFSASAPLRMSCSCVT